MLDKGLKFHIFISSFLCAVVSAIFALTPTPLSNLVWVFFLSFTISNATPHSPKEIPNLFFSQIAGWVWAMLMYYIVVYTMKFGGNLSLGFFIAIFVGAIIMFLVHFKFLMNTWFNNMSMVFAPICSFFAIQDFGIIVYIMIALTIGSVLAAIIEALCGLYMRSQLKDVENIQ